MLQSSGHSWGIPPGHSTACHECHPRGFRFGADPWIGSASSIRRGTDRVHTCSGGFHSSPWLGFGWFLVAGLLAALLLGLIYILVSSCFKCRLGAAAIAGCRVPLLARRSRLLVCWSGVLVWRAGAAGAGKCHSRLPDVCGRVTLSAGRSCRMLPDCVPWEL